MEDGVSSRPLQTFRFRTDDHAAHQRFEAWSAELAPLFDTVPATDASGFEGEIRGFLLDEIIVIRAQFDGQRYQRGRGLAAGAHQDNYLVQLYTRGGFQGEAAGRPIIVAPGDVCVLDLAMTVATDAADSACVSLILPKRLVDRHWQPGRPVAGAVFAGHTTLGQVLGGHLAILARSLDGATAAEAPILAPAAAHLVASALGWSQAAEHDPAPLRAALFQRAVALIRRQLDDAALSPRSLCAALNVSRPHLYRAFEAVGGVHRFIQRQRLLQAREALRQPGRQHETIGAIADRCGFASVAHFSTLFRAEFGACPRDIRGAAPIDRPPGHPDGLPHWLDTPTFRLAPQRA